MKKNEFDLLYLQRSCSLLHLLLVSEGSNSTTASSSEEKADKKSQELVI